MRVCGGGCYGTTGAQLYFRGRLSLERLNIEEWRSFMFCFSIKSAHESFSTCSPSAGHCCAPELPHGVLMLSTPPF